MTNRFVAFVATGRTRELATSTWHEIQADPVVGWASSNFLAPLAPQAASDVTERVVDTAGEVLETATLTELAGLVAAQYASTADPQSRIRTVAPPSVFEGVAEVTIDVVGQPGDSVRGYRLAIAVDTSGDWLVAAADGDITADAGLYTLRSVSVTPLCSSHRGVSDDGRCN